MKKGDFTMNGLTYIRKLCNLSSCDVADILGVSRQAVSSWENGKIIPEDRLKQLSNYFGVQENYFSEITDEDKEYLAQLPMVRARITTEKKRTDTEKRKISFIFALLKSLRK